MDEQPDLTAAHNAVFQAAATIPMNKDDLGESFLFAELKAKSAEEASKLKAEWLAEGYDADHPRIDIKFLDAVRQALQMGETLP